MSLFFTAYVFHNVYYVKLPNGFLLHTDEAHSGI